MKCHLCDLKSQQLNGFTSCHWRKHETVAYTRDQYLADLLTANGKPPKTCPICNKQTRYSRENADWDKYCSRECFFESTKGKSNPNFRSGLIPVLCTNCGVSFEQGS